MKRPRACYFVVGIFQQVPLISSYLGTNVESIVLFLELTICNQSKLHCTVQVIACLLTSFVNVQGTTCLPFLMGVIMYTGNFSQRKWDYNTPFSSGAQVCLKINKVDY